jgi:hypothetical protein
MVPFDVSVPRASGTLVKADGGVAELGATVNAMTVAASVTAAAATAIGDLTLILPILMAGLPLCKVNGDTG